MSVFLGKCCNIVILSSRLNGFKVYVALSILFPEGATRNRSHGAMRDSPSGSMEFYGFVHSMAWRKSLFFPLTSILAFFTLFSLGLAER